MACIIDAEKSVTFQHHVKALKKKYPNVEADLKEAFQLIAQNHTSTCNVVVVPGIVSDPSLRHYGDRLVVYKYRVRSRDMQRGKRGGFRVLACYDKQTNTLYPFAVYTKEQYQSQPENREIVE